MKKINMICFIIINKDIISMDNLKDIKFFNKDYVYIVLKTGWNFCLNKYNYVILMINILSFKFCFLFIFFSNINLIIKLIKFKYIKCLALLSFFKNLQIKDNI